MFACTRAIVDISEILNQTLGHSKAFYNYINAIKVKKENREWVKEFTNMEMSKTYSNKIKEIEELENRVGYSVEQ